MADRLNILHCVEFYHPSVGGAQEVVKQLSQRLAKRGHKVTVATSYLPQRHKLLINQVKIKQFKISGNQVNGMTGNIKAYQNFIKKNNFDIIMTYAAQQWTVDALLPILSQIKAKKVLVPCGFSAFYDPNYSQYFFSMSKYIKQYDWLIFLSRQYRDIEFARKYKIKHFSVIPNGAGADEFLGAKAGKFRQKYNLKNKFIVLTVGSHTGDKGHIQCIEAFKMAKLKNAVLVIIGNTLWNSGCASSCKKLSQNYNRLSFLHQNKILVLDPPRQEIVQAFLDADLFVFASKIECSPLVLFEAMASKIPFLTTPVGNAAEIIKWSQGGLLIKSKTQDGYVFSSPEDFARQLKRLQSQPNLRNKLGYNGFRAWKSQFTWEKIVDQYEKIYYELIKE